MLRGQNPCMFQPIPGHCYAPLPSTHKQNESIMDEAFSLLSPRCCQSVGRPRSECSYKQPLFHYSYRCFNEEVDLTLFTHRPCKQPRILPHLLLFLTVVCLSSFFLIIQPAFFNSPSPQYLFTTFDSCEGIPAARVVFSGQCSTGIWLSCFGLRDLQLNPWLG